MILFGKKKRENTFCTILALYNKIRNLSVGKKKIYVRKQIMIN